MRNNVLLREDFIHYHVRVALREHDWRLIAGQYPNGSDDELPSLNVVDPRLARDQSPDHRRHSQNKLVPDLVAVRAGVVVAVEMKSGFDPLDEAKLLALRDERRDDFNQALSRLSFHRGLKLPDPSTFELRLVLGFSGGVEFPAHPDFAYLGVKSDGSVVQVSGHSHPVLS